MAALGTIGADQWFEHLFGFKEHEALRQRMADGQVVRNPALIREKLELRGDQLVSLVNGASYGAGVFSTPSLSELRERAAHAALKPGRLELKHIATRDVFELHSQPDFGGATFMAASQFNCLEFPSPEVVPEDGCTNYVYDGTQGPACALAAPAATVARHYHVPVNGRVGQSEDNQLNLLGELLAAVQGTDGEAWQRGGGGGGDGNGAADLVTVRNGYSSSDEARLAALNARSEMSGAARDETIGRMRIGVHAGVEVPWGPPRFSLLPEAQRQRVTQTFCSALAVGYSHGSLDSWAPLAEMVLDASYEATLLQTALQQADGTGSGQAVLTFLGGGVFGNRVEWIEAAIAKACVKLRDVGLRVVVSHYGSVDQLRVARLQQAIDAETARAGEYR